MYVAQMPTNIVRLTFFSDMTCDRIFSFGITTDDTSGTGTFLFFFIEIENFRGEGQILTRHTHDTF
jgi:hypothetical protein